MTTVTELIATPEFAEVNAVWQTAWFYSAMHKLTWRALLRRHPGLKPEEGRVTEPSKESG